MKIRLNILLGSAGALALVLSLGRPIAPAAAAFGMSGLVVPAGASVQPGTAFAFQGQLRKNGAPLSATCASAFRLLDAPAGGLQIGPTVLSATLQINNGLFTVPLDFGADAFNGAARWLESAFGCGEAPATLTPRTAILPVPYAQHAARADVADNVPATLYTPLLRPQSIDLATLDATLKGFEGGFTDGRYGYLVPSNNGVPSGKVARIDLQNFVTTSVASLDLTAVFTDLKGFDSGFTDGRYGYFVPYVNSNGYSGKVARIDLQRFVTSSVSALDLATIDPALKGFWGGFTDGRYGYFVPYANDLGYSGKLARVDLQDFVTATVTVLDLASVSSGLRGFAGGFTDGHYGYLVPYFNNVSAPGYSGVVARVDLLNFVTATVVSLDLAGIDPNLKGFEGGFTDGRYGYFVPNFDGFANQGKVARVDLRNFAAGGVTVLDLAGVDAGLKGFQGGFTDGRYAYFAPRNPGTGPGGKVARVDVQNFTASGTTFLDMAATDAGLKGFQGGFTDGRYGYFVPYDNGSGRTGKLARIQLLGGAGAP